jgi:hypothetical protein
MPPSQSATHVDERIGVFRGLLWTLIVYVIVGVGALVVWLTWAISIKHFWNLV